MRTVFFMDLAEYRAFSTGKEWQCQVGNGVVIGLALEPEAVKLVKKPRNGGENLKRNGKTKGKLPESLRKFNAVRYAKAHGYTAAGKKYKVSGVTVKNWENAMKKAGKV